MAGLDIYTRVSSRGEREEGRYHSPAEQREAAERHARARGFELSGRVFHDESVSGAVHPNDRPGMRSILDRIRSGESGGIVAMALDRLSRDPSHGDWLVREVTKAGGVVTTIDIPDDIASPTGEFTFGMLLQVARLYRRTAGARFATAKERAISAGVPVGPVPVGYRQVVPRPEGRDTRTLEERRIEPDPETAPVIAELFERRAKGEGMEPLAKLMDAGAPRPTGKWSKQGVAAVLRNRLYATGLLTYGDTVSPSVGAIVDEALFQAAQRPRDAMPPRRAKEPWLLSGLVVCGSCGNRMVPWSSVENKKGERLRRYRCANRSCDQRLFSLAAPKLEEYVTSTVFALLGTNVVEAGGSDTSHLEEALVVAERRLAQVMTDDARDALGPAWAADVKEKRLARDEAAKALGEARMDAERPAPVRDLRADWPEMTPAERREALSEYLIRRVLVHGHEPAEWEIEFK